MKIPIKKHLSKKLIIAGVVIGMLLLGSLVYVYGFNGNLFGWRAHSDSVNNKSGSVDYGPATSEQKQAGNQVKTGSSDVPPAPTAIPGSNKKNIQILILTPTQSNGVLSVRTQIGAVEDTGTCTLTLTSPGYSTVTKTSDAQAYASISTCQGFDIPISELSVSIWHVVIEYNSTSLTGSAATDVVIK